MSAIASRNSSSHVYSAPQEYRDKGRTRSCQRTRNGKLLTKSWVRVSAELLFANGGPFMPLAGLNGA